MHEVIWYNHGSFPEIDEYGEVTKVVPDSNGIPGEFAEFIKVVRWNDINALQHVVEKYRGQVAAIVFEPICFNLGCSPATSEYVKAIREICDKEGILMVMDEVITGMRFRPGSAAGYFGVQPDLTTFAKAIGGGMSISLVGGKKEIMDICSPGGNVGVSGTYSGNQMAVYAANECVKMALEPGFYDHFEAVADKLFGGMNELIKKNGLVGHVASFGARFAIYWGYDDQAIDLDLRKSQERFRRDQANEFINRCLDHGLYFHSYGDTPYPSHCGFSVQHTLEDVDITLERMDDVMKHMSK